MTTSESKRRMRIKQRYIMERGARVAELKVQGKENAEIVKILQVETKNPYYNLACVKADLARTLDESIRHSAIATDIYREVENRRLDYYLDKLGSKIRKGDIAAIDRALKISEMRSKLLGLNAEIEIKVEQKVNLIINQQFNQLFEAIAKDPTLSDEAKEQIITIASDIGSSFPVA